MLLPAVVVVLLGQSAPELSLTVRQARSIAQDWFTAKSLPGLSVAVIRDSDVVWTFTSGLSDLEQQIPVTRATRFRLGSASKVITAGLTVRLADQGKLDLDAPVQQYLPAFPVKRGTVTPRLLAGHLGGIPHYSRGEYPNTTHYDTLSDALKRFADRPLIAAPGQTYWYSSYGFNLLGAIDEAACGRPFAACLASEVSQPLKLDSLILDDARALIPDRARTYSRAANSPGFEHAPPIDSSDRYPSGGMLANAIDLARFATGLWNGWVSTESAKVMATSQLTATGRATDVGLGWRLAKDGDGRRYVHHGGEAMGGRAIVIAYPGSRVAVAVATNLTFAEITEKDVLRLAHLFLPAAPLRNPARK